MFKSKSLKAFAVAALAVASAAMLSSCKDNEQAAQEGFYANGVSKTIQMATVMFATVPILLVYPWLQRYFVSGVTIGAVKG